MESTILRPAWKSYVAFFLWITPSLLVLFFGFLVLFPKVHQYIDTSTISARTSQLMMLIVNLTRGLVQYFWIIFPFAVLVILLPEIIRPLRRWRGIHLFCISYAISLFVLLSITLAAITVMALAPGLPAQ
jgi:hypothetical protein